jgi:cytochrome c-type biogenesis protein
MSDPSVPVAFWAGMAAFITPCVLPLVPIYLANLGGVVSLSPEVKRWTIFFHTLSFVAGFTVVYTALGASAGVIGRMIPLDVRSTISGALMVVFGIYLIASIKFERLNFWSRLGRPFWGKVGYLRSALMGIVFALAVGPCTGPILGGILSLAGNSETAWKGAYLLAMFSLGLGIPFLAISLLLVRALPVLNWLKRRSVIIMAVSGLVLVVVGILMLVGVFSTA